MTSADQRPRSGHKKVDLHSVLKAAEILDCSDMHVYRLVAAGELRAVDIGSPGSRRPKTRIRSDDLAAYIERNTQAQ
jgi:excisionase family DNA binding protein